METREHSSFSATAGNFAPNPAQRECRPGFAPDGASVIRLGHGQYIPATARWTAPHPLMLLFFCLIEASRCCSPGAPPYRNIRRHKSTGGSPDW